MEGSSNRECYPSGFQTYHSRRPKPLRVSKFEGKRNIRRFDKIKPKRSPFEVQYRGEARAIGREEKSYAKITFV